MGGVLDILGVNYFLGFIGLEVTWLVYILEYLTLKCLDGAHAEEYRQETLDKKEETGIAQLYIFVALNHTPKVNTGYMRGGEGVSFGGDAHSR